MFYAHKLTLTKSIQNFTLLQQNEKTKKTKSELLVRYMNMIFVYNIRTLCIIDMCIHSLENQWDKSKEIIDGKLYRNGKKESHEYLDYDNN